MCAFLGNLPPCGLKERLTSSFRTTKGEEGDEQSELEMAKEKAKKKTEAAIQALAESKMAQKEANQQMEEKQAQWNQAYEKVCLELQREEEIRYTEMVKVGVIEIGVQMKGGYHLLPNTNPIKNENL